MMNISNSKFEAEYILSNEHGKFHPVYVFDDFTFNEAIEEYEYIGLVITKTAQEVYDVWLANKDKPIEPQLSQMEVLEQKVAELKEENKLLHQENKLLHAQVEVLGNTTDFHEELIAEMAMMVYA